MFSFGEQLYRLTGRDEETLLIDPFFRWIDLTLAGAATNNSIDVTYPIDRALFIRSVSANLNAPPGAFSWTEWTLQIFNSQYPIRLATVALKASGATTIPLASDGALVTAVGQYVTNEVMVDYIFPPGLNTLRFGAGRNGGVADATARILIKGYLLPPGQIGRVYG